MAEKGNNTEETSLKQLVLCSSSGHVAEPTWCLFRYFRCNQNVVSDEDEWVLDKLKRGADPKASCIQIYGTQGYQDYNVIFKGILSHHLKKSFEYVLSKGINLNDQYLKNDLASCIFFNRLNDSDMLYFSKRLLENGLNPKSAGVQGLYFENEVSHACGMAKKYSDGSANIEEITSTEKVLKKAQQLWNEDPDKLRKKMEELQEEDRMLTAVINARTEEVRGPARVCVYDTACLKAVKQANDPSFMHT